MPFIKSDSSSYSCNVRWYSASFWSAFGSLRKVFVLILTLGKLQNVFDNVSLKTYNFELLGYLSLLSNRVDSLVTSFMNSC